MTIVEKTAYLKGLTDGLGIGPESKEGKLWAALNDVLSDIAHELEKLHETDLGQAKAIDGVADELSYLEELCGGFDSEDDENESVPFCGSCCKSAAREDEGEETEEEPEAVAEPKAEAEPKEVEPEAEPAAETEPEADPIAEAEDEYEDEELQYDGVIYDATCPVCGEEISFDEETLAKGSIQCPNCGETLEFDLGDEEEQKDGEEIPF